MLTELRDVSPVRTPPETPEVTQSSSSWNPITIISQNVKYVAARSLIPVWEFASGFDPSELQRELFNNHDELNWKMGSTAPAVLLQALTDRIVAKLKKTAKENQAFYNPTDTDLINLRLVINATLTRILLNINKSASHSSNPFLDILRVFAQLGQKHFPAIAQELPKIRDLRDERERKRQLKDLFAPLAVDFFKLAFPNGKQDLPLPFPVNDIAWDTLKRLFHQDTDKPQGKREYLRSLATRVVTPSDIIPPNFAFALYDTLMSSLLADGRSELLAIEGGEFWEQLSQFIANKTIDHVPSLLSQKNDLIAKEIVDLLEINPSDSHDLRLWFGSLLQSLRQPDPQIASIWQLLTRYLVSTINHRFLDMHKNEFNGFKSIFSHVKETVMPRIIEIEKDLSPEKRRDEMIRLFEPVSDRIIALSGLENPNNLRFPFFTKELVVLIRLARRNILPEFLTDFYDDVTHPQRLFPQLDRRLKLLFFDENFAMSNMSSEERAVSLRALYHRIGDPENELWTKSGITELSRQIKNTHQTISISMRDAIKNYLKSDSQNAAQLLIDFLPKHQLKPTEKMWLSLLIKQAIESGDSLVERTFDDLVNVIEYALLHVFVYIGERTEKKIVPEPGAHAQKYFVANLVIRLLEVVHRRPNITSEFKRCQLVANPAERQQLIRKVFEPLAQEFLQVGIENPFEDLPMLRYLKADIWDAIQTKIVPDMLEKVYRRLNFWQARSESSKQAIRAIFGTTHPEQASKVISHYGSEYIPYYLTFAHNEVALKLSQQAEEWFREVPEVAAYLRAHKPDIVKLIGSNIHQYGESLDPAIQANKSFSAEMIDGLILKLISKLAHKIHTTEQQKQNFMVESFKGLLEVTARHFLLINQVTHQNRLKHAWNVPYEQMVRGFGENLHPGIPQPHLSAEEQSRHRMERFYKPATQRLFRLLDLENDPEFQEFINTEPMRKLWAVVQENLFPSILQSLFEKLSEPHTIRTMLINSLESLSLALSAIPAQDPNPVDDVPDQPELNMACGQLVLQLLGLVPRTLAHSVFEIDRVQRIAAQTIGSAISRSLRQWTWIKIMDKGIYSGIPSFRMGAWDGAEKIEKFVPMKLIIGPDGRQVMESEQLSFNFPKTEQGKALLEARRQLDERATEVRLKHLMAAMTSRHMQSTIESIVKKYWDMVQDFVDDKIQLYFGLVGLKAKEGLDIIFGTIVFDLMVPLLQFVITPFTILFWYLMEEFLAARADDLSKDAIHRIQENLFFGLLDKFLDNFDQVPAPPVARV